MDVENVGNADQNENQHLAADAFEADRAGQLLVRDGAEHVGDVVADNEDQKRDQQAIAVAEKVPEPSADHGENELYNVPEFLHQYVPP